MNLGVQFQASAEWDDHGIRFYKEPDNTGTHTGTLWTASGTQLATGTFTNESDPGLGGAGLLHPGAGHRGDDLCRLLPDHRPVTTRTPPAGSLGGDERAADRAGQRRGLRLRLGHRRSRPTATRRVELLGRRGVSTRPGGRRWRRRLRGDAGSGSSSNPVSTAPTVTFSEAVVPSSVSFTVKDSSGNSVAGSTSFNSADTVATFTPSSHLAAGTTYHGDGQRCADQFGPDDVRVLQLHVHLQQVVPDSPCPCTVWPDVAPSGASDPDDSSPNNIGVQFKVTENGTILGYPVLQGAGRHRYPYRDVVVVRRDAAGDRNVHQRLRRRAGRSWTSPPRCR